MQLDTIAQFSLGSQFIEFNISPAPPEYTSENPIMICSSDLPLLMENEWEAVSPQHLAETQREAVADSFKKCCSLEISSDNRVLHFVHKGTIHFNKSN